MPFSPPTEAHTAPPQHGGWRTRVRWRQPQQRVRVALYLAFAVLALAVLALFNGWRSGQIEGSRGLDRLILEHAAQQQTLTQQIGRLAAQLVASADEPASTLQARADTLARVLDAAGTQALALDDLLSHQAAARPAAASAAARALAQWHAVRERLWYRGQLLLRSVDGTGTPELQAAAAAVQTEADAALDASRRLAELLGTAAQRRGEALVSQLRAWMAGLVLVLALLALAVVEPTARALRRQFRLLRVQATELQRLALVAEQTQAMVIITDRNDRIEWVNAAFSRLTGWSPAEAAGRLPRELLARAEEDSASSAEIDAALAQGRGARTESPLRTRDGRVLWFDVDLRPLRDEAGALTGFVSVSSDVTERVQQRQQMAALWAALPAGVVLQDAKGRIVEANRAAERLLGLSFAQMQGRGSADPRWQAVRADGSAYPGSEHPAMRTLRSGEPLLGEIMGIQAPDGEPRWLLVNTEPQRDSQGAVTGVVACFSDVTEHRQLQAQLHATSRTDALTALPNRTEVMERLQRAIEHAQRHAGYGFAVLFMDIDRFKQINDTLGHGAGDELLRQVAERLRLALRPGDAVARIDSQLDVAARIGGDEFVVVLDGARQLDAVLAVAERLLADLGEPYTVGDNPVQSGASIGIVLVDGQARSAEDILRNADTAMYEAKRAGRGRCVVFDPAMHESVVRALSVQADLRVALKEDQLFVVYQPVVDLGSGALVGVEALVRWQHPQRGLVPPLEFIGIAEECGLIDAVGSRVMRLACEQFVAWQRSLGPRAPRQLAVNLSRAQLKRVGLVAEVAALLQRTGMAARQLQLEITESLAAQDEGIQATLRELKGLGVGLALDDFGTGYSSLACLHQLPVDTVKIDRSFVQHAETVEYHRVLIEATIRVARTLGMRTVAEGIETAGQAALMQRLHCDRGQGWFYGRPMTAAELPAWAQREAPSDPVLTPA